MPFFYCLHDLSSGLEPAFNRAASRSRTQRVRASSPVTSTSSLWTPYRSQRLFQSHFSLTLSQLLFQHDPLRWARAGFLNGMQSICIPFFIVCTIFHQASNLFSIASRAEAAPCGCVLRVLSPRPRRCGRRIARSDFFKVTSHSLCHSSSSNATRCAGLALDS